MTRKKGHKRIFLIGSGRPKWNLNSREKLKDVLESDPYNYQVFTMESYPSPAKLGYLWSEKFINILQNGKPDLVCVIFPKKSKHGAVEWELGILAHRFQDFEKFLQKIVFTLNTETTLTELSFYSQQLAGTQSTKFENWPELPKTIDKLYKIRFK